MSILFLLLPLVSHLPSPEVRLEIRVSCLSCATPLAKSAHPCLTARITKSYIGVDVSWQRLGLTISCIFLYQKLSRAIQTRMHTCHNSARSLQPLTDMASKWEYMIDEAHNCALPANVIDNTSAIELLFAQWTTRLSRIGELDADTAAKMKGALVDNGIPWSASQRRELEHLISVSDAPTTEKRGKMQKAFNFENLLSQDDWAKLRKGNIEHVKVALLARRAATLNIKNASEATLFRMTDIIAYCSDQAQYDQTKKS